MVDDAPLVADFCSICQKETPNYCCPGCFTRTCSLNCYDRHKKWYQCSGRHDPAKYIKNNPSINATALDHDYNYLTRVARVVELSEKDVDDRSIRLPDRNSNFSKRLIETGVHLHKAPKLFSRAKSNKTRWSQKQRCMLWTVEWILPDRKSILGECTDKTSLADALKSLQPEPSHQRKKRKLQNKTGVQDPDVSNTSSSTLPLEEGSNRHSMITESLAAAGTTDTTLQHPPDTSTHTDLTDTKPSEPAPISSENATESGIDGTEKHNDYFYLFKPRTVGSKKVLIPLPSSASLFSCLQNQTVLEYPTIYILRQGPTSLPEEFELEADYTKRQPKMIEEVDRESLLPRDQMESDTKAAEESPSINEAQILQSLQRDIDVVKQYAT